MGPAPQPPRASEGSLNVLLKTSYLLPLTGGSAVLLPPQRLSVAVVLDVRAAIRGDLCLTLIVAIAIDRFGAHWVPFFAAALIAGTVALHLLLAYLLFILAAVSFGCTALVAPAVAFWGLGFLPTRILARANDLRDPFGLALLSSVRTARVRICLLALLVTHAGSVLGLAAARTSAAPWSRGGLAQDINRLPFFST